MNVGPEERIRGPMGFRRWHGTAALASLLLAACGGNSAAADDDARAPTEGGVKTSPDAGRSSTGEGGITGHHDGGTTTQSEASPGVDGSQVPEATTNSDGPAATTDAGGVCTPEGGSAMLTGGCTTLNLAVMQHSGGTTGLILTGSLGLDGPSPPACIVVDGVDIVSGSTVIQHLSSVITPATNNIFEVLATGTRPVSDITNRCTSNDPTQRIDPYGIVLTGRATGGTFKASCADSTLGTSWPPALVVTCHSNIDDPPMGGSVSVQSSTFMGMALNQAMVATDAPHGAGGALTSIDNSMFVIPAPAVAFGAMAIPAFNTTGWTTSVSEATNFPTPFSLINLDMASNPFPSTLCPPGTMGAPPPGTPPPPVFLGRITGMGGHGAFSTEAYFNGCQLDDLTPP
jgi:hypothetical protein